MRDRQRRRTTWPGPELERFCRPHDLLLISIADLIRYRRQTEKLVRRIAEARIPTQWGDFTCFAYESVLDGEQHVALVRGDGAGPGRRARPVHSECLTGDVFGSLRCDCGLQLDAAMAMIAEEGLGVVVYLRGHEGRGIGIGHKIAAYQLQERRRRHGRRQPRAGPRRSTAGSTASAPRSSSTSASPPCGS